MKEKIKTMGNQVVIPSMGNWYIDPLKKNGITVNSVIESGTFFLTLDCFDNGKNPIIVKAYQSDTPIEDLNVIGACNACYKLLHDSGVASSGVSIYTRKIVKHNLAFLIRRKHQFTLTQRLDEYPPLHPIEKQWIAFRIVSLVLTLDENNISHQAINPDNIFVNWDLEVNLGDIAPFKPTRIKTTRPDLFHHFFASASRSYSYLAPEQLIFPGNNLADIAFLSGDFSMDFFSTGLVLYYLYTGKHLFSFSRLIQYASGQIQIDEDLSELPGEIRGLVANYLQLDPSKRKLSRDQLLIYFPKVFSQIDRQFIEFFNSGMELQHLIKLIPTFRSIIEDSETDIRLIFINVFMSFLNSSRIIQEKVVFASFICDYTLPLSDTIKLSRVLPVFCSMLSLPSNILKCDAFSCIVKLVKSLHSIPEEFSQIFDAYLIKYILVSQNGASVQYRCALASLCPLLTVEIARLKPEANNRHVDAMKILNFILQEQDNTVIGAFVEAMKSLSHPEEDDPNVINENSLIEIEQRAEIQSDVQHEIDENSTVIEEEEEDKSDINLTALTSDGNLLTPESYPPRGFALLDSEISSEFLLGSNDETSEQQPNTPRSRTVSKKSQENYLFCIPGPEQTSTKARGSQEEEDNNDNRFHRCRFKTFEYFSTVLLSCLNSNIVKYKTNILDIFSTFFDNSSIHERHLYRRFYATIAPSFLNSLKNDTYDPSLIEGYLGFLLWFVKRNLLSPVYYPELFLRISKYRSSPNSVFRYYASAIISYIPPQYDVEKDTSFISQILFPQKSTRRLSRKSTDDNKNIQQTIKPSPLILKTNLAIAPKFINSKKLSTAPIQFIVPFFKGRFLISDTKGAIYCVDRSISEEKKVFTMKSPNTIVALSPRKDHVSTLIGYHWSKHNKYLISVIDWNKNQRRQYGQFSVKPVKILSTTKDEFYVLLEDGQLSFYDCRICNQVGKFIPKSYGKFDSVITPTALTTWNECSALGLGFSEGIVDIIDPRMMMVVKSVMTQPVNNLIPVYHNSCNFMVSSHDRITLYDAVIGEPELTLMIDSPYISSYDGNAVVAGVNDVYHIDCEYFNRSSILGDFGKKENLGLGENTYYEINPRASGIGSLHKHNARITCLERLQNLFLSGDENGFVHLWSL